MKEVMKNLEEYARKKNLKVEKTKMMVFNTRKMKSEENEWNWEGRKIEQVNEFKHLGYKFNEEKCKRKKNIFLLELLFLF
jgi:trehalose-6-phosphatase